MGAHAIPGRDAHAERDVRRVLDGVRHLVRALRLSNHHAERRVGLTSAKLFVLQSLRGEPGLSLNEVARRTSTDQSSVSVVVTRLVDQGLVHREKSPEDGRRLVLRLSPEGAALLRKAPPRLAQEGLVDAAWRLAPRERQRLGRLLDRLVSSMGEGGRTPGMFFEREQRGTRSGRDGD